MINLKNLTQLERFMRLCAGRVGQILNLVSLSNDVGVSSNTIKHWISILEASFVLIRLEPYFENFGKRMIKSPKLYFTDVGLATFLLGIENTSQLERDPLRGNLVENLALLELMKARLNQGLDPKLYYFRDTHQNEIDIIYQSGRDLIPIEIKASQTYHSTYLKNLHFFKNLTTNRCPTGYIIYSGSEEQQIHQFQLINITNTYSIILSEQKNQRNTPIPKRSLQLHLHENGAPYDKTPKNCLVDSSYLQHPCVSHFSLSTHSNTLHLTTPFATSTSRHDLFRLSCLPQTKPSHLLHFDCIVIIQLQFLTIS